MLEKRIVTICNYPNRMEWDILFYMWASMTRKHSTGFEIFVYSENDPNPTQEAIAKMFDLNWVKLQRFKGDLTKLGEKYAQAHNIRFKLWCTCGISHPFLFIDLDAIPLHNLNDLWKFSQKKPFIGINHQRIPRHTSKEPEPFLNSGVMLVSDPNFLNYYDILANWNGMKCKGFDQAMLFSHFKGIGYKYTHRKVGKKWNSCAGFSKLFQKNGDWKGKTKGIFPPHKVYINHYWDEYRPWKIACPMYESFKLKFSKLALVD